MDRKTEKRAFERIPLDLIIQVTARDSEGKIYRERSVLTDISGEGAKFLTDKPDAYFVGQDLEMIIYLPGAKKLNALMRGRATVVRIDAPKVTGMQGAARKTGIAVTFKTWLGFERANRGTTGESR